MEKQLTIVIPCFNEEESIPLFFPGLLSFANEHSFQVIAVNDGSSDHTQEKLEECARQSESLTVLRHKCNRGYGAAIKSGLEAVQTEYAITIDADGQHRLQDILACFNAIRETDSDLVVGARTNHASGSYRKFGKFLIRAFARSLFSLPVKDLNSGMKCYRMSETRPYLELCPDTMAFSDIILLLMLNDKKKVTETPIEIMPRNAGKSTIGTVTAMVTITEILNLSVLLRPLTTFFRFGIVFLVLGLIWGGYTYWNSNGLSSAAIMLFIFGFFCFILGLLGEQLSQIRKRLAQCARPRAEHSGRKPDHSA